MPEMLELAISAGDLHFDLVEIGPFRKVSGVYCLFTHCLITVPLPSDVNTSIRRRGFLRKELFNRLHSLLQIVQDLIQQHPLTCTKVYAESQVLLQRCNRFTFPVLVESFQTKIFSLQIY